MLVAAACVPVVRRFRENGKNEGAGFKIKPESFTCLKDRVQKKLLSLGPKVLSHCSKYKGPEVYVYLPHDLFPRSGFLQALPSGKHTLFLPRSPISYRSASFENGNDSIFVFSGECKTPFQTKWGWSRERRGKKCSPFPPNCPSLFKKK